MNKCWASECPLLPPTREAHLRVTRIVQRSHSTFLMHSIVLKRGPLATRATYQGGMVVFGAPHENNETQKIASLARKLQIAIL